MSGTSLVDLRSSVVATSSCKSSKENYSFPLSFDIATYTRILSHMNKLYPCDSEAVAASLSALSHNFQFSHLSSRSSLLSHSNGNASTHNTNGSEIRFPKNTVGFRKENGYYYDKALDLSTPGLKSIYSQYRRITLNQIKPKIIEDIWVENDIVLNWTDSKVAAYNPAQKLFMCVDCECVGFLSRVAEHWLGAHANMRVFHCPRCPYTSAWSRCVKMHLTRQHNEQFADTTMWKENSTLLEVTKLMQELRTKVETKIDATNSLADKRFYCPYCPYATDRRDLFTRHENIHKDNKPFHCYLCFKQFNRADHVKKHFVRMHPDSEYDISKIRKQTTNVNNKPSESLEVSTAKLPVGKPSSLSVQEKNTEVCAFVPSAPPTTCISDKADCPSSEETFKSMNSTHEKFSENSVSLSTNSPDESIFYNTKIHSHNPKPTSENSNKIRRRSERAFSCHYCNWSGTDNWCLKRHMNTHIKPFACILCEYKAARAERLSTHVWKVHNKRICNKCNFLADTQERLLEHTREEHYNNPYSRRHICGSCGMSFDTRANLETHMHLSHTRPKSPFDVVHITPLTASEKINKIKDLSEPLLSADESMSLICPKEDCSKICESSCILAEHVRREHSGLFASRCPHCSYNLTQDELAKDHWLTHHEDVCNACVHVFTSVYGPQLWKKVHSRPQSSGSPLNSIVNGLNKKKVESDSKMILKYDSALFKLSNLATLEEPTSDGCENDKNKRKRKQSCPKKVITMPSVQEQISKSAETEFPSRRYTKAKTTKIKRLRCSECAHRPYFTSLMHLRGHKKLKHKRFNYRGALRKKLKLLNYSKK